MISKRPTMADVAAQVGVSRQLVGLAFRDEPGVGSRTRERIFAAAAELGYSPDVAARQLRQRSSNYLGVLFNPAHSATVDIVEALYPAARRRGYSLVLGALASTRTEEDAIAELLGYRIEAAILIAPGSPVGELRQLSRRMPVVDIGRPLPPGICDVVRSAGYAGITGVVDHLVELGHQDIAYVSSLELPDVADRLRGYREAMEGHGLPERVSEIDGDFTEESGAKAAEYFLKEPKMPTAIVCSNDHAALGLIHVLLKSGLRVPEDVSVTGYDDSRIARLSYLDLTTVRQDPADLADAALDAALRRLSGDQSDPGEFLIEPTLRLRGSTAEPRTASS